MLNILKQFSEQILAPDQLIRKRYGTFKKLLAHDRRCHTLLAELEDLHYNAKPVDISRLRVLFTEFSAGVAAMISCLQTLAPGQYRNLTDYHKKIDFYARFALAPPKTEGSPPWILPLKARYRDDRQVGGKGMHLAQLSHDLSLPVPTGFIVSTSAWHSFLEHNALRPVIDNELAQVQIGSLVSLRHVSQTLTDAILTARLPPEFAAELSAAIDSLAAETGAARFAVRSSAVGEDLTLSFAGQYLSLLQLTADEIPTAWRRIVASKYTPEALLYRILNGLDDEAVPMAALILTMVEAHTSGVVTTETPPDNGGRRTRVHMVHGLGNKLMSGEASGITVDIHTRADSSVIIQRQSETDSDLLSEPKLLRLSRWAEEIEEYYSEPQEIEWSCDINSNIYLLQARRRNATMQSRTDNIPAPPSLPLLFQGGEAASTGSASGVACILRSSDAMAQIPEKAILVCEVTPPSLVAVLPKVAGVIARLGSVADHFSSVAREFGVPVLVKTNSNIEKISDGEILTLISDTASVYQGRTLLPSGRRTGMQLAETCPVARALKMVIDFSSPLQLIDTTAENFRPEGCRSMHDIIRFAHEKSVQAMFLHNPDSFFRKPSSSRLVTDIPLQVYIIDVGGSLPDTGKTRAEVTIGDVDSLPFRMLWKGLTHPAVNWRDRDHFDWKSYDNIALAGGIAGKSNSDFGSYCLLSREYLNIHMRFGYHFALLDCLCTETPEENYILLRFAGGGGTGRGKDLRLAFVARVLARLNFDCEQTGELLDARLMRYDKKMTADRLDQIGRLLGATRLLDMVLKDEGEVDAMVESYFQGVYDFSSD